MRRDTRTALLASAESAARTSGFAGFSYADLADDVGIKKASIHYHFPSKTDLAAALMQSYSDDMVHACAEIDQSAETAAARLTAQIARYKAALNDGTTLCLCVAFSLQPEVLCQTTIAQMKDYRAKTIAWLTATFELGQSDGSIMGVDSANDDATATLALLEGAQLAARAQGDVAAFDNATANLQARLAKPT